VSKFHLIWCLVAQELKLGRKFLGGPDISDNFTGYIHRYQIYIRSKVGHVCWTFSAAIFYDYFDHILTTRCLIDPILFPLYL
jgi:hypothetical protein